MQTAGDAKIETLKDTGEHPPRTLESHQKTAIAFGIVLLVGVIACTTYLVGRMLPDRPEARSAQSAPAPRPVAPVVAQTPAPAPVAPIAEPKATPPPVTRALPLEAPVAASAVTAKFGAVATPLPHGRGSDPSRDREGAVSVNSTISSGRRPSSIPEEPAHGQSFLQVGSLAQETATPFLEALAAKGFKAISAPGVDSTLVRILVGPLTKAEMATTSEALTKAGFKNFPKTY